MTRKITAALTALVMCAGLSACGEKAAKEDSKTAEELFKTFTAQQ